ncbi:hypothetical protein VNI00_011272 [Paramarasmius palmivorus]|uniref:Uncharacterized protein n=1 Tax=Paramarasmius palmivorus TaxID=297713 RepID=A0AAW0CHI4_9AGAR
MPTVGSTHQTLSVYERYACNPYEVQQRQGENEEKWLQRICGDGFRLWPKTREFLRKAYESSEGTPYSETWVGKYMSNMAGLQRKIAERASEEREKRYQGVGYGYAQGLLDAPKGARKTLAVARSCSDPSGRSLEHKNGEEAQKLHSQLEQWTVKDHELKNEENGSASGVSELGKQMMFLGQKHMLERYSGMRKEELLLELEEQLAAVITLRLENADLDGEIIELNERIEGLTAARKQTLRVCRELSEQMKTLKGYLRDPVEGES